MSARYELRVEAIDESHIGSYVRLATAEFGSEMAVSQHSHLRWKLLANPAGPATGIHLYCEDELIGRYIYWPRQFRHGGKIYRVAIALDTLIDRRHRRLNVLMQLLSGLKQVSGFDLLLSIAPNDAGWKVSKKFVAMDECFELDVAIAPIGPAEILHDRGLLPSRGLATVIDWPWRAIFASITSLGGRFGRCRVTTEWPKRSELDALFVAGLGGPMIGDRSPDFLDWRFRQSPLFKYELQFLYEAGSLVGYLATRRANYDSYDCRFVVDAFGLPTVQRRDWAGLVRPMLAREARAGAEMSMLLGTARCGSLASAFMPPFLHVPARFMPRRMTVFAKWLAEPGPQLTPGNLYLTLADYDVV